MDVFYIYLWGLVDPLSRCIAIFGAFLLIAALFFLHYWLDNDPSDSVASVLKNAKWLSAIGGILILLATLIPDQKTLSAMYILPKIADSKVIKEDAPEIYNLAIEKLKATLKAEK